MNGIKNRAKDGPIKWGALNLTLFTGATLSIGTIITFWNNNFKSLFGFEPQDHPGATAAIFGSVVIAIALVVAADLLTRGIASSHPGETVPLPKGWQATLAQKGKDDAGYSAAAVRTTTAGLEVLVVNGSAPAEWRSLGTDTGTITLDPPSES